MTRPAVTTDNAIASLSAQILASFSVPPTLVGPEPLRCPACGRTRLACVQFWGHDPVHDNEIRAALSMMPWPSLPLAGN